MCARKSPSLKMKKYGAVEFARVQVCIWTVVTLATTPRQSAAMLFQNHHYWDSENYKQLFPTVSDSWFWLINVWFDFETTSLRARVHTNAETKLTTLAATRRTLPNLTLGFHSKSMWEFPHWNFQHLSSDCSRCTTAKVKKKWKPVWL